MSDFPREESKALQDSQLEAITSPNEKMGEAQIIEQAKEATEIEHTLSVMECVKNYPMAIFWSLMVSMCVVMEGYDVSLIGNFFAYPTFAKKYGNYYPDIDGGTYTLTAPWQSGVGNASGVGAFFGVMLNGWLVDWYGQKRTLLGSLVALTAFVFITFFAPDIGTLTAGEVLCGLPWGVFASTAPAYASEVLPLQLRIYLTSYTNMCFIMGQLIAAGVLKGLVNNPTEWAYKIPFAIQWVWPAFLIPILLFAPESPWHLVRKGRFEEAEHSLRRLQRNSAPIDPKATLAAITYTDNLEKELTVGTHYRDCFKGTELRRTEIACFIFAAQVLSGGNFAYNSTYFFKQIGLNSDVTYKLSVGGTGMALVGTLISWFALMPYFGRRTIYLWGMTTMCIILMLIGILNIHTSRHSFGMTQAILTLVWTFVFQLSVGQLGWGVPAEVGSTRLRQKTVCLARNAYYVVGVVANALEPYFMNPTEWNLKGYTGFVWGGTTFVMLVWGFFRLPETKGRSFDELDVLFAKKVSARKFKGTVVDTFDESETAIIVGNARG